jgi:hypothetical protein
LVGYYYAADEGAEGGADEGAAEEPAHSCGAGSGSIDVAEAGGADNEEGGALEGSEDAEDEEGDQVWGEGRPNTEGEEENRGYEAYL